MFQYQRQMGCLNFPQNRKMVQCKTHMGREFHGGFILAIDTSTTKTHEYQYNMNIFTETIKTLCSFKYFGCKASLLWHCLMKSFTYFNGGIKSKI